MYLLQESTFYSHEPSQRLFPSLAILLFAVSWGRTAPAQTTLKATESVPANSDKIYLTIAQMRVTFSGISDFFGDT
jgi:hypothetical protein